MPSLAWRVENSLAETKWPQEGPYVSAAATLTLHPYVLSCSPIPKFPCSIGPSPRSREKSQISKTRGTNSGTLTVNLTRIIAAWPDSPPHFQAAIVTLCQVPGNAGEVPLGGVKLPCIRFLKLLELTLLSIVFTLAAWAAGEYFGRFYFSGVLPCPHIAIVVCPWRRRWPRRR